MRRRIRVVEIASVFEAIRRRAELPIDFPPAVLEEASRAHPADGGAREDLRSIPFVTIDPPEAMDLDQAVALEPLDRDAIRLHYAIADVGAFVPEGSQLDREARRRGTTVYCPDLRIPLHPPILSEGSASLLPGVDRPAVVFEIDVDGDGALVRADVRRATIRSRERFDYRTVQAAVDIGSPPEPLALLRRFGEVRIARGIERGAVTLRLPEQEAVRVGDRWTVVARPELAVERWNAEVSLLTGMVAAEMMIDQGTGILRTLPAATAEAEATLREDAAALGIEWGSGESAAEVLARLDPSRPRHLALFEAGTRLLRGAGYLGFSGGAPPGDNGHGGVAADYAHVTAPLRRLADRFTLEACLAAAGGGPVPAWVDESVAEIATTMQQTAQRAGMVEGRCLDSAEAWVMGERIGERFPAVVLATGDNEAEIWIDEPPILTRAEGIDAEPGETIGVEVHDTDVVSGMIRLSRYE